jgi:hypothetical protein
VSLRDTRVEMQSGVLTASSCHLDGRHVLERAPVRQRHELRLLCARPAYQEYIRDVLDWPPGAGSPRADGFEGGRCGGSRVDVDVPQGYSSNLRVCHSTSQTVGSRNSTDIPSHLFSRGNYAYIHGHVSIDSPLPSTIGAHHSIFALCPPLHTRLTRAPSHLCPPSSTTSVGRFLPCLGRQ